MQSPPPLPTSLPQAPLSEVDLPAAKWLLKSSGTEIKGVRVIETGRWGWRAAHRVLEGGALPFPHPPLPPSSLSRLGKRTQGPSNLGHARHWTWNLSCFAFGTEMPKAAGEEGGERNDSAPAIRMLILPLMLSSRVTMARAPHLLEPGILSVSRRPQESLRAAVGRTGPVACPMRGSQATRCPGFRRRPPQAPARLLQEGAAVRPPFLLSSPASLQRCRRRPCLPCQKGKWGFRAPSWRIHGTAVVVGGGATGGALAAASCGQLRRLWEMRVFLWTSLHSTVSVHLVLTTN